MVLQADIISDTSPRRGQAREALFCYLGTLPQGHGITADNLSYLFGYTLLELCRGTQEGMGFDIETPARSDWVTWHMNLNNTIPPDKILSELRDVFGNAVVGKYFLTPHHDKPPSITFHINLAEIYPQGDDAHSLQCREQAEKLFAKASENLHQRAPQVAESLQIASRRRKFTMQGMKHRWGAIQNRFLTVDVNEDDLLETFTNTMNQLQFMLANPLVPSGSVEVAMDYMHIGHVLEKYGPGIVLSFMSPEDTEARELALQFINDIRFATYQLSDSGYNQHIPALFDNWQALLTGDYTTRLPLMKATYEAIGDMMLAVEKRDHDAMKKAHAVVLEKYNAFRTGVCLSEPEQKMMRYLESAMDELMVEATTQDRLLPPLHLARCRTVC